MQDNHKSALDHRSIPLLFSEWLHLVIGAKMNSMSRGHFLLPFSICKIKR